jgi:release factor glutamine methyltransferase
LGPTVVARLRAAGCVFAEDEARLLIAAAGSRTELDALVDRRISGLPVEQILGWAGFCGLRIAVDPGVFVPRRRTEFLAGQAIALAAPGAVVVDLCCGSGAVGAAILAARPEIELYAADIDPAAVRCAARNLPAGTVFEGDLYDALPPGLLGRIDVLAVNAPYVPTGRIATMPPEAREHEAPIALDGGRDGLRVQRRVAAAAPDWLAPGGRMLIETSERQAPDTARILAKHTLAPRVMRSKKLDATIVIGQRPG